MMQIPFTQTKAWGAINQCINQLEPIEITESNCSCLFGLDVKQRRMTSFGGPIIADSVLPEDFLRFLRTTIATAKRSKVHHINFHALMPIRQWPDSLEKEFKKLGFSFTEWKTLIVDLSLNEDALQKNLAHAARKGIKKAGLLGVKIQLCDTFESYYTDFLVPYFENSKRCMKTKDIYKKSWALDSNAVYRHWIAKTADNQILGFLGTYRHDSVATEIMSALTPLAFEKKIPAQDLLHWEIIKYHKNLGDLYFDLAGFNPNPSSEKEINIRRFKEKWGGDIYDTPSYTLDNRTFISKVFSKITIK